MARVRLLGVEELAPGKDAFLQLMLQNPIVALRQDRFIIRRPSPSVTIGGGQVVDPHPGKRHKRYNTNRLGELEQLLVGTPEDILFQTAQKLGASSLDEIIKASGLENEQAQEAAQHLVKQEALIDLNGKGRFLPSDQFTALKKAIKNALESFHQENPLRPGMPREQLKSQTSVDPTVFDALITRMARGGILDEVGAKLRLKGHQVRFTKGQQEKINVLMDQFESDPYAPPSYKQSVELIGEDLVAALVETGQLIPVSYTHLTLPTKRIV